MFFDNIKTLRNKVTERSEKIENSLKCLIHAEICLYISEA